MELGKVKARIEKYSKENGVDVQVAWDSFFFNEFLYRLSLSRFKDKYVFKGGFFLQKVLGVGSRSTMDIDFKYSGELVSDDIGASVDAAVVIPMMNKIVKPHCFESFNGIVRRG